MDEELRGLIREALDLYRRHIDVLEKTRAMGWRWLFQWLIMMIALMAAVFFLIGLFSRLHIL
jgi:hypothetical protein